MRLRKLSHSVCKTQCPIVFVTKYRRRILTKGVSRYLKTIFHKIHKCRPDVEFVEIGIDRDHVRLHVIIPPKYPVSDVVRDVKSSTSKRLRVKFGFLEKVYWRTRSVWSKGFFASTVGIDEQTIRNYVKWQDIEDNGQAELEI